MPEQLDAPARRKGRGLSPHKPAQTRQLVVKAALDTFLEQGFHQTRMIDVADGGTASAG